ncbi:MAG: UDP-N-acetylmuramoyl-L-alanine--D-glutamate ligase [Steroidobacteraceae bacterium]
MSGATTQGKALIVGLGRSGLSAARHLAARGWQLAVTDTRLEPPGAADIAAIAPQVSCRFGGFDSALLEGADIVVASPGVSLAEPLLREAQIRGIEIVGDIELFAREVRAPVVGITGTNGKSTVTTLVGRMAARAGVAVAVGGNLGTPALDLLENTAPSLYVLELSSFQLETTSSLHLQAAAVLNLTADHLDRYADMASYGAAKARIFRHCTVAVINLDDSHVTAMPTAAGLLERERIRGFSIAGHQAAEYHLAERDGESWLAIAGEPVLPVAAMRLPGMHNAANALAALALGDAAGLPREAMLAELREFTGLPHRSQWVGEHHGVRYINDSKGTNVGATLAAVGGMPGPLVLIAGGDGKGQDFSALTATLAGKLRFAALIGRDAAQLAAALTPVCPTHIYASLEEAVLGASQQAHAGDTVLLSPACASLDMFRDYAHRGEVFAAAVTRLAS